MFVRSSGGHSRQEVGLLPCVFVCGCLPFFLSGSRSHPSSHQPPALPPFLLFQPTHPPTHNPQGCTQAPCPQWQRRWQLPQPRSPPRGPRLSSRGARPMPRPPSMAAGATPINTTTCIFLAGGPTTNAWTWTNACWPRPARASRPGGTRTKCWGPCRPLQFAGTIYCRRVFVRI